MTEPNQDCGPNEGQPTDEQERLFESDSLAEELGIEINFADDEFAPPVDRKRIRGFVRRELAEDSAFEVGHLIASYRAWFTAWREILADESGRPPMSG